MFRKLLTTNERCFIWCILSLLSQVQVVQVKHCTNTWHFERIRDRKDWTQVSELKADWRSIWEYQKWKVQTNAIRAWRWKWETEELSGTGADLSLPIPCQLSYLSPRKHQRSSGCRRYPVKAVQTHCIRSQLRHQVRQENGFSSRSACWFLSQWIQHRT